MTQRMSPDDRKEQILTAAMKVAKRNGYRAVTRELVATEAKISKPLITRYFEFSDLIDAIVLRAIAERNVKLVAEALADGHKQARRAVKAQEALRHQVSDYLFP